MKVKFGSLMVDGRGKIGGHVASKNRGGAYMRTKVTPVNPQTTAQTSVRSLFTLISQAWRALTDSERKSFNSAVSNYAKTDIFGDLRNPSGANLHQRLNQNIQLAGGSAITSPSADLTAPALFVFSAVVNETAGTLAITWTSGAIPANTAVIIEATGSLSPGKSFVKNQYRQVVYLPAADTSPTDIYAAYVAKFGAPVIGQKVFIRAKSVNLLSGLTSGYSVSEETVI